MRKHHIKWFILEIKKQPKKDNPFFAQLFRIQNQPTKKRKSFDFLFFISKTERRHRHLYYYQKLHLQTASFWFEMDYHPDLCS
jgi:hypothetical protein